MKRVLIGIGILALVVASSLGVYFYLANNNALSKYPIGSEWYAIFDPKWHSSCKLDESDYFVIEEVDVIRKEIHFKAVVNENCHSHKIFDTPMKFEQWDYRMQSGLDFRESYTEYFCKSRSFRFKEIMSYSYGPLAKAESYLMIGNILGDDLDSLVGHYETGITRNFSRAISEFNKIPYYMHVIIDLSKFDTRNMNNIYSSQKLGVFTMDDNGLLYPTVDVAAIQPYDVLFSMGNRSIDLNIGAAEMIGGKLQRPYLSIVFAIENVEERARSYSYYNDNGRLEFEQVPFYIVYTIPMYIIHHTPLKGSGKPASIYGDDYLTGVRNNSETEMPFLNLCEEIELPYNLTVWHKGQVNPAWNDYYERKYSHEVKRR